MARNTIKFNDDLILDWMIGNKTPSVYTLCETIALAGLENKWIRLSAGMQRKLIGGPVFGKCAFKVSDNGAVLVMCKTAFGFDSEVLAVWITTVIDAIKAGKRLIPGGCVPAGVLQEGAYAAALESAPLESTTSLELSNLIQLTGSPIGRNDPVR